jgi:hypothetical protein
MHMGRKLELCPIGMSVSFANYFNKLDEGVTDPMPHYGSLKPAG